MAYEKSKFGNGLSGEDSNVVKQVSNHFGRFTGGNTQGAIKTEGGIKEITIDFDWGTVNAGEFPLEVPFLPALGLVTDVYVEVEEAFDIEAASEVNVGVTGTEATNGVSLSDTVLGAVGVADVTSEVTGTMASSLNEKTDLGIAYAGADATAGKARLVIRYVKV